jgi:hypothetical protein
MREVRTVSQEAEGLCSTHLGHDGAAKLYSTLLPIKIQKTSIWHCFHSRLEALLTC